MAIPSENEVLERIIVNIHRLRNLNNEQRESILERADSLIPEKAPEVKDLVLSLCYERGFCKSAGINYSKISPEDSRLIRVAVADYLMQSS
jgi:hypothetical protein